MKKQTSTLQTLLKAVLKFNNEKWADKQLSAFNRDLFRIFQVDVNKIQAEKFEDLKTLKQQIKQLKLEKAYLLVAHKEYYNYKVVLTDLESKKRLASLTYYGTERVVLKKGFDNGFVYLLYCDDEEEINRVKNLRNKRYETKKNSCLDPNSILYRSKNRCGNKDKSRYISGIERIYKKFCDRFINGSIEDTVDYVLNKELRLFKLHQEARKKIFKTNKKYIRVDGYSVPSFDYELKYMREAICNLQNKEDEVQKELKEYPNLTYEKAMNRFVKYQKSEIYRNFNEIMRKEQYFKNDLNRNIACNK